LSGSGSRDLVRIAKDWTLTESSPEVRPEKKHEKMVKCFITIRLSAGICQRAYLIQQR